jgi:co-chaperonin GroES (HSP10)
MKSVKTQELKKIVASSPSTVSAPDNLLPGAQDICGVLLPAGFKLLVCIPRLSDKTRSGIIMPEETRRLEEQASVMAQVIALGPLAYKDDTRFPNGPWCKAGDYIMMRRYSGTAFVRDGYPYEYRLINDDTVEAVLVDEDPGAIKRAS